MSSRPDKDKVPRPPYHPPRLIFLGNLVDVVQSTMATHLEQRGYGLWADDVVVWTSSEARRATTAGAFEAR
jgi:hypothetical protein